ncbi:DUF881 domain-containing protein [Heliorestis acidaminivorans]|uniref:DUF881 domain-containing protein n=1 Tax=Heliorestis acidaminivorans TaxID=553427 RepID=A0A6I0F5Q7_9FIRM|nr:DUF881 domain-containing protein [Heliorestis acidaminivorans]KAB2954167.1 DUF881 domain-containing protein [Heliorestis acidaminivorans]
MKLNQRTQAILVSTIVCFFVGFSLMVQWRTQAEITKEAAAYSVDELTSKLIQMEQSKDTLNTQMIELRSQLNRYRDGEDSRQALEQTLERTRLEAGFLPLEGPGIVITLDDSPLAQDFEFSSLDNINDYYIHDWYLRELVNALWTGGAEAISINHQRLISSSEIFCGGTTIFVNRDYITPPFVIKAVGDPKNLTSSVNMVSISLMLRDYRQRYGITYDVLPSEKLEIPAYRGDVRFRYARTVTDLQQESVRR